MRTTVWRLSYAALLLSFFSVLTCATREGAVETDAGKEKTASMESDSVKNSTRPAVIGKSGLTRSTYSLGITPEQFYSIKSLDTQMMYEAQAAVLTRNLSLEEKVGQLFIISMWNSEYEDFSLRFGPWEESQLSFIHPGGVLLFGGNIDTVKQTEDLCSAMQRTSKIPLFIATDQEGGRIGRLYESGKIPATHIPPANDIGATGNTDLAYLAGWISGKELSALGINVDFAPVVDILQGMTNPVIGSRSFGSDPELVAAMSIAFANGIRQSGVVPVFKHFPGHGGAESDPHLGSTVDNRSFTELEKHDLIPFIRGIAAGIDWIMTAHVILPKITGDDLPASFSPFINTALLRDTIGFRGIIVTDSISMGAVSSRWNPIDSVVKVIEAGADCILEPSGPRTAYNALLLAVREGVISENRIDASVRRILAVKLKAGIIHWEEGWGPAPDLFSKDSDEVGIEKLLKKYIPNWENIEGDGIGSALHEKINALIVSEIQSVK